MTATPPADGKTVLRDRATPARPGRRSTGGRRDTVPRTYAASTVRPATSTAASSPPSRATSSCARRTAATASPRSARRRARSPRRAFNTTQAAVAVGEGGATALSANGGGRLDARRVRPHRHVHAPSRHGGRPLRRGRGRGPAPYRERRRGLEQAGRLHLGGPRRRQLPQRDGRIRARRGGRRAQDGRRRRELDAGGHRREREAALDPRAQHRRRAPDRPEGRRALHRRGHQLRRGARGQGTAALGAHELRPGRQQPLHLRAQGAVRRRGGRVGAHARAQAGRAPRRDRDGRLRRREHRLCARRRRARLEDHGPRQALERAPRHGHARGLRDGLGRCPQRLPGGGPRGHGAQGRLRAAHLRRWPQLAAPVGRAQRPARPRPRRSLRASPPSRSPTATSCSTRPPAATRGIRPRSRSRRPYSASGGRAG